MSGIFVASTSSGADLDATISAMDKITQEWTLRAARGECGWICSDCCATFSDGMPDDCAHGHQGCTDIIRRDKAEAAKHD